MDSPVSESITMISECSGVPGLPAGLSGCVLSLLVNGHPLDEAPSVSTEDNSRGPGVGRPPRRSLEDGNDLLRGRRQHPGQRWVADSPAVRWRRSTSTSGCSISRAKTANVTV